MDIQVKEKQLPVITTNFEEMKSYLTDQLSKYEGLIVTEQSLEDDKKTQKQLTKLKKNIDTYRKDLKKELSNPIKTMEEQLKELMAIVESVEQPIKEGIEVFNDKIREANIEYAQGIINEISAMLGLNRDDFIIPSNFTNLTMTQKKMIEEIERQAKTLKEKKDAKLKNIELLKANIEQLNTSFGLEVGLTFTEYQDQITGDNFMDLSQVVLQEATRRKETQDKMKLAMDQKALEKIKSEEVKVAEQQATIVEKEVKTVDKSTGEIIQKLSISLKLTGTNEQLTELRAKIDELGIEYTKL